MDRSVPVPVAAGQTPQPFKLRLAAQNVPIKSVSVDNPTALTVNLYMGSESPIGTPVTIPPQTYRSMPIASEWAIYVVFTGTATATGTIYIHYSDEQLSASAGYYVQTVFTSQYPFGATPWFIGPGLIHLSAGVPTSPVIVLSTRSGALTVGAGQTLYISSIMTQGYDAQQLAPQIQGVDGDGVSVLGGGLVFLHDPNVTLPIAMPFGTFAHSGAAAGFTFTTFLADAPIGNLAIAIMLTGYVL